MFDFIFDFLDDIGDFSDLIPENPYMDGDWYDTAVQAGQDFTNSVPEAFDLSSYIPDNPYMDGDWYDVARGTADQLNSELSGSSWLDKVTNGGWIKDVLGAGAAAGAKALGSKKGSSAASAASAGRVSSGINVDRLPTRAMGEAKGPQPLRSVDPFTMHGFWMERMRSFARLKDMIDGTKKATTSADG